MLLKREESRATKICYGDIIELNYHDALDGVNGFDIGIVSKINGDTLLVSFDGGIIDFGSESMTVCRLADMMSFVAELNNNTGHYVYNHYSQDNHELQLVAITEK